jgi:hypothetical protein
LAIAQQTCALGVSGRVRDIRVRDVEKERRQVVAESSVFRALGDDGHAPDNIRHPLAKCSHGVPIVAKTGGHHDLGSELLRLRNNRAAA